MMNVACLLAKRWYILSLLSFMLLCGCGPLAISQTSSALASAAPNPFQSYVGKWEVHGVLLTITAKRAGLEQWNVGPCSQSTTQTVMCNGNAKITFTLAANGSIKGTLQSVSYSQWDGTPVPAGFRPDPADPRVGDAFQLRHSGAHLLYTTWFGKRASTLNSGNRYWCDAYALKSGWKQCGA